MAGRLIGESENDAVSALTAKTLLIHHTEEQKGGHNHDMGHGVVPEDYDSLTTCHDKSYTLIYNGEIKVGSYAEYIIPWEYVDKGKINFRWTVGVMTDVDELSTDDYTSTTVEVAFYPNRNKYVFYNDNNVKEGGIIKGTEIVDTAVNHERATQLIGMGWRQATFPKTDSVSSQFKNETELRDDLKWDSLDVREVKKIAKGVNQPTFHVHGLGRGDRNGLDTVNFSLILTVSAPAAEFDIYTEVLEKYSALSTLSLQTEVEIEVGNDDTEE
jgi:hypothetical protein